MAEPDALAARVEDAGINASAPPQQRWIDGWIVRFSPGKARRARCVYPVAEGRLPLAQRLALAERVYRDAGLPMVVRFTPFVNPALEAELAARGWPAVDDTRVMICRRLPPGPPPALPPGVQLVVMAGAELAELVGGWRGSPPAQRRAHAERLAAGPVPYRAWALLRNGQPVACGQTAQEADLVGLYDVFTRADSRGQGLARLLCEHLLSQSASNGAASAYLQCEADNAPARHIYRRLGFADAYAYHYRQALGAA